MILLKLIESYMINLFKGKKQQCNLPVVRQRFKMVIDILPYYIPYPESEYIKNAILENNDKFITYKDLFTNDIIVECENKPRDLAIWGIWFVELNAV